MTVVVKMPMLSMSMSEGDLVEWLVEEGALVEEGQPIYSVESEKAVMEVESPASGIIHRIATAGTTLPVGADLATIVPR